MMFCTSLRKRSELRKLVNELTESTEPHFKESNLKTFDLALGVPTRSGSNETIRTLQVLVLTPSSLDDNAKASTMARIEHFAALGADSSAVAFVLSTFAHPTFDFVNGLRAFLTLQLMISEHPNASPVTILPVTSPSTFISDLSSYAGTLHQYLYLNLSGCSARTSLLPHMTSSAPSHPLSEHNTNILSDICHSISDVAELADSEQGQFSLEEWLEEAGRDVTVFWQKELAL